jgi:nucleotide-binding universal stress UspA family protein
MRIQLRNIMSTTDLSEFSNHTIAYGAALCREFRAQLHVCHVINLPSVATYYGSVAADPVEEQRRLRTHVETELMDLMADRQIQWEPLISLGHVADEIARLAADNDVDLVVAATHGRSGLKRLLLGSVTERLMRTLPCPLMIIGGPASDDPTAKDPPVKFRKILVGCDFSDDAETAFQYGLSLAQEFQSKLVLAHVIAPPIYLDLNHPVVSMDIDNHEELEKRLNDKLSAMIPDEVYDWCSPDMVLLSGQPYAELVRYAEDQAVDLMVLGARGYNLVEKLFVGSTTDRVVRRAPCPVLSVRPKPDSGDAT